MAGNGSITTSDLDSMTPSSDCTDTYNSLFQGPPKRNRRRPRVIFDDITVAYLEREFARDQYPCVTKREEISEKVHIPESRIHTWFQNKRSRVKRHIRKHREVIHQTADDSLGTNKKQVNSPPPTAHTKSRKSAHSYTIRSSSPTSTPRLHLSAYVGHVDVSTKNRDSSVHSSTSTRFGYDGPAVPLDLRTSPGIVKPVPVRMTPGGAQALYTQHNMWLSPFSSMIQPKLISVVPPGTYLMNPGGDDVTSPFLFAPTPLQTTNPFLGGMTWLQQGSPITPFVMPQSQGLLSCASQATPPHDISVSPVLDDVTDSSGYTSSSIVSPMHSPIDVCN